MRRREYTEAEGVVSHALRCIDDRASDLQVQIDTTWATLEDEFTAELGDEGVSLRAVIKANAAAMAIRVEVQKAIAKLATKGPAAVLLDSAEGTVAR
jgi:hypothetical protein